MLLIEKVVKLLDDFHYDLFYEYVRTLSKRSYYPLVLVEVVDRQSLEGKTSEKLFFEVYGDEQEDQKDLQKLFQLGHYTFRLTSFLSRNYPDYLYRNIARIQHRINTGQLAEAKQLADMLLEVAQKVEDYNTQGAVLGILAQHEIHQQSLGEGVRLYRQIADVVAAQRELSELNILRYEQAITKSNQVTVVELEARLARLVPYRKSKSVGIRLLADVEYCYLLHTNQDARFFDPEMYDKLNSIREELNKFEFIVLPFLTTLRSKLDYLRLRYSMRQLSDDTVVQEAEQLSEDAAGELFWHSYVNLPEMSSIGVQTSFLVSNYFYSYRPDRETLLDPDVLAKIERLKNRCEDLLDNPLFREQYIIPYINMTTIYAGLLLLGDRTDLQKCVNTLEYMLLHFQQVAFHAYLDPVFVTLIMANFAQDDYAGVEKSYRRYKKSTKGKNVNFENDLEIHAYYYVAKYRETQRNGYAKKLDRLMEQAREQASLAKVLLTLQEVCEYFSVPVEHKYT